jgi:hypothetical protein
MSDGIILIDNVKFTGANVESIVIDDFTEEPEMFNESFKLLGKASAEMSCSIKMATDAFTRFVHLICGIKDDLESKCSNRRVVHLSKYARKNRTRKKNYNRMIRIVERGDEE